MDRKFQSDSEKMREAYLDFEKHFGCGDEPKAYLSQIGNEDVIVVENKDKRAFYSMNVELLKIIKLTGEE